MKKFFILIIIFFYSNIGFSQDFKVTYLHGENDILSISIIDDNIWIGGYLGMTRVNRLNYNDKEIIIDPFVNYKLNSYTLFTEKDNNGNLFIHNFNSLYKYNNGNLDLIRNGININCFQIDENNTKWILNGSNEIIKIANNGNEIIYNPNNSTLPNYDYLNLFTKNNITWLGSNDDGFIKFDGTNYQLFNNTNSPLPYNIVNAITIDMYNNIWLSCHTYGSYPNYDEDYTLVKISGTTWTKYNKSNSGLPPQTRIFKIIVHDDVVFLCTNKGLIEFDGSSWRIYNQSQNNLLSNNITTIAFEGNNKWIGTDKGISVLTVNNTVNIKIANATFSGSYEGPIIEDLAGNIWVGTSGSNGNLNKYNGETWQTIIQGTTGNPQSIYSLAVDKNNVVWATAYNSEGTLYKIKNDLIIKYDENNSPLPEYLEDIVVDKYNNKWIMSSSALIKFDDTLWTIYNTQNFQYLIMLRSIATDSKGNIWIGIDSKGMVKFDGVNWTHYDDVFFGNTYSEVNKIIIDTFDNIWMDYSHATSESKICKFDGNILTWYGENINLPPKYKGLLAIEENGDLWYSYKIDNNWNNIAKYDWNEWKFYNSYNTRLIYDFADELYIDHHNNKWVSASYYVAKFNEDSLYVGEIKSKISKEKNYSIFPNPCNTIVYIKSSNLLNENLTIKVYDLSTKELKNYSFNNIAEIELNFTNYPKGIYLIQIISKSIVEFHKLIKL